MSASSSLTPARTRALGSSAGGPSTWAADELTTSPTSENRRGLMGLEIGHEGPTGSPLEQLGRLAGVARKGTLENTAPSEPSSLTLRPNATSPYPLVFNSFRNSSASLSSTYYTSSIYSTSEDNHAYWEGRRPDDEVDNRTPSSSRDSVSLYSDDDDTKTERGADDDRDELEEIEDDDETVDSHDGGWQAETQPYATMRTRPDDGGGGSADFTTSTRLSRMLLDSEDDYDPDATFSSQWSAPSHYSSEHHVGLAPAPDLGRSPSMSGVNRRQAEVTRSQADISSVYGQEGDRWEVGGDGPVAGPWVPPEVVQPASSNNFSRPIKASLTKSPVSAFKAVNGEYVNPPKRSTSLRRKGPAGEEIGSRSPSPTRTPGEPERAGSVPFPRHLDSSPSPASSPVPVQRQPRTYQQPQPPSASSSSASTPCDPHFQIDHTFAPPRPKFATSQSAFGSSSNLSLKSNSSAFSAASLPTRRAPPPPTDVPAFHGHPSPETPSIRVITTGPSMQQQPRRQPHPSNSSSANWTPTVPPSTSTKYTPIPPSQRKLSYPPPAQEPSELSLAARSRTQSAAEQGGSDFQPPRPSFTVTSRSRSESNATASPLSSVSSSSSRSEIVGSSPPKRIGTTGGTSRAELHPGLFSVYELGPSSRSSSPTAETFAAAAASKASGLGGSTLKGSYTKVEIVDEPDVQPPPSEPEPEEPPARVGPEQYLKLGIQHHSANRSTSDLSLAAMYFKEAATIDGGCPGGMLFWGLSLRSGWGVARDEKKGFEWLRRACEPAPPSSRAGAGGAASTEPAVLAPEMVVAILEVAQCFLHGWGCSKDPEKAVNYLLVAAKMGDVDAQLQLASCYLHGLGTKGKKDKAKSAFWFRAAIDQGASDAGLSWVYKKKYTAVVSAA